MSERARARLGPRELLLGGVFIALLAAFAGNVNDPDFWWHLQVGRWMIDHRALPSHDLFTYTVPGHPWIDHEYLAEVLMALLWQLRGALAVSLAFAAVTWAGFWCIWRAARGGRRPYVVAGLSIVLAAMAGEPIWGPRAQMITFALVCLELLWLRSYLEGRSRRILWFPLVMVLWANLHGGWVIAFVFLVTAMGVEALRWLWDRSDPAPRAHLRTLAAVTGLSVLAVAATPHGVSLYAYPFITQFSPAQQSLIVEWFSPDFHQRYLLAFLVMILLLITGFAWRRPSLLDLALTLAALALALISVRNVALFVAAATPAFIVAWSGVWEDNRRVVPWLRRAVTPAPRLMTAITAVLLAVIAVATSVRILSVIGQQSKVVADSYPVAAADWLAQHPEIGGRMYNQYGWGGYLTYRFYPDPRRRVFIFGEAELMGDRLLRQYQDVQTLQPNWQQVLDDYQVNYVVFNTGEPVANVLATEPDRWRLVYKDKIAVIYVRISNTAAPAS